MLIMLLVFKSTHSQGYMPKYILSIDMQVQIFWNIKDGQSDYSSGKCEPQPR